LDEVNFWQPRASVTFAALKLGGPFLFKLHSPDNYIVGGGFFAYWTRLPMSLAWDAFGEKNGAPSLAEMTRRIEQYRRGAGSAVQDYDVGCILLGQAVLFREMAPALQVRPLGREKGDVLNVLLRVSRLQA